MTYKCHAKFWPSLVMALILALFLQLSSWQWHRYHEKLQLQTTYQAALSAPEISLGAALEQFSVKSTIPFTAIKLAGHYDTTKQIVMDNRSQAGKPGYEIYTPFILNDTPDKAILINRGFVPLGHGWKDLPDLSVTTESLQLSGFLTLAPRNFILGPEIEHAFAAWPLRLARINFALLKNYYPYSLVPYVVLLKPQQPGSYLCQWSFPSLFAERSLGYAFQWLALALATIILWTIISFKKDRCSHE